MHTWINETGIYSIDLLFVWANQFHIKGKAMPVEDFTERMAYRIWGDSKSSYSPMDVLLHSKDKRYKDDIKRIKAANLKYPVFVSNGWIVDGWHRLCKVYMEGKKTTKVIVIPPEVMQNVLLGKNWSAVDKLELHEIVALFYKRFCKPTVKTTVKNKEISTKKVNKTDTKKVNKGNGSK